LEKASLDALRIDRSEPPAKGGRTAAVVLGTAVLVALAAAGLFWTRGSGATPVETALVTEAAAGGGAAAVLNASGYVTARRKATVSAKITGKVTEILLEEGMRVEAGQILARLDDVSARLQLAFAESELQSARTSLQETEVRLAEANLNLRRSEELVRQEVASTADVDAARAQRDSLAARLAVGRQQVDVAGRGVALRRQELDDTIIRAPFTGVVVSKDAQPGEMISPVSAGGGFTRTGIGTLVDMTSLEIEVDVNEAYIGRVVPEQRVEATLDAYPDWRVPARVITTIPTADRQKATVRVRIGFEQLDARILPDMGVKVAFLAEENAAATATPALRVPRAAIRSDSGQDVVFVVNAGTVERRAIRLGPAPIDPAVVLSGLTVGEEVVVVGPVTLENGDRVRIAPPNGS
jgi:RND family efflux transporter MFP subunit